MKRFSILGNNFVILTKILNFFTSSNSDCLERCHSSLLSKFVKSKCISSASAVKAQMQYSYLLCNKDLIEHLK